MKEKGWITFAFFFVYHAESIFALFMSFLILKTLQKVDSKMEPQTTERIWKNVRQNKVLLHIHFCSSVDNNYSSSYKKAQYKTTRHISFIHKMNKFVVDCLC